MNCLRSHPDLYLREHIEQVKSAMEGIWKWHSRKTIPDAKKYLFVKLACLHDAGKASKAFQEYIKDPANYHEDPLQKSHTPLSLVLTLIYAKQCGWKPLDTLLVSACVYGHHGTLPMLPEKGFGNNQHSTLRQLDDFTTSRIAKVLKDQLKTVDMKALGEETEIKFENIGTPKKLLREANAFLEHAVMRAFYRLNLREAIMFRLKTQLAFSVLLEADKTFLAITNPKKLLSRKRRLWKSEWVEKRIGICRDNPVNAIRNKARSEVISKIAREKHTRIYSMTAPTGIGKTLLGATWALMKREAIESETGIPPKVIVIMPYLSVIEQTALEYRKLLELGGRNVGGSWFLTSHSLSDRTYSQDLEENSEQFFIDTWRTELIITTYDQFLLSLTDPRTKYQMRFHNLCDSLIIMDEVQSIPCRLWRLLEAIFHGLTEVGNSQLLLMSATLPPFVSDSKPLLGNFERYFKSFSRYELRFSIKNKVCIGTFCDSLKSRLESWVKRGDRVLITLNTRKSAVLVYDCLKKNWPKQGEQVPLLLLSADVTPRDRLQKIEIIKRNQPCVVISTQCIEAGVDIDMGIVIRDFAPWDSIVQIAGRCNREGKRGKWLPVELVNLVDENGQCYCDMIYDDISLYVTRNLVMDKTSIKEEEILDYSNRYFNELEKLKDTGTEHLEKFAKWREDVPIRELLRGKSKKQYSFLIIEQDPSLKSEMKKANEIRDRWKRREAWRSLAGRIAKISVSLFAREGFSPDMVADEYYGHWILREKYYSPERGMQLPEWIENERKNTLVL